MSRLIRCATALLGAVLCGQANASAFDKPTDTQVVRLPPDPANPQAEAKRTCTYYPGFVVKEVDLGEVGASELSITAFQGKPPKCTAKIAHEVKLNPDDWSGYFRGAKGDYIFFDADDGWNDGMAFAVYGAKTGHKIFSDARKGDNYASLETSAGALTVRYRRVWQAPCSLMSDAAGCWKKVVAETSLSESKRPDCTAAYRNEMKRTPKFAKDIPALHTVISYEAEARVASGKLSITPRSGTATCWLPD